MFPGLSERKLRLDTLTEVAKTFTSEGSPTFEEPHRPTLLGPAVPPPETASLEEEQTPGLARPRVVSDGGRNAMATLEARLSSLEDSLREEEEGKRTGEQQVGGGDGGDMQSVLTAFPSLVLEASNPTVFRLVVLFQHTHFKKPGPTPPLKRPLRLFFPATACIKL